MSTLTPYLCVEDARRAIAWYREHLGAEVVIEPIVMPDGRIGHVELEIGGACWMMADPFPEIGVVAPSESQATPVTLHLTVPGVDAVADAVQRAGITFDRGPEDDDHAGRIAGFRDPFGHRWLLNTPKS